MRKYIFGSLLLIFGVVIGLSAAFGFNKILQPAIVYASAPAVNVQSASLQQVKTPVQLFQHKHQAQTFFTREVK